MSKDSCGEQAHDLLLDGWTRHADASVLLVLSDALLDHINVRRVASSFGGGRLCSRGQLGTRGRAADDALLVPVAFSFFSFLALGAAAFLVLVALGSGWDSEASASAAALDWGLGSAAGEGSAWGLDIVLVRGLRVG